MSETGFGRRTPTTWRHVERYPLAAAPEPERFRRTPVVLGINWYSSCDKPEFFDNRWWVRRPNLGIIEGGHAILVDNGQLPDRDAWYHFYNQGRLSACVGFSLSRAITQFYKVLFDGAWLWNQAKASDEWDDTNPGDNNGTSIDAGARILNSQGSVLWSRREKEEPNPVYGIGEYRWAGSVDEILEALASPNYAEIGGVPLLNSWGEDYPRVVWLELTILERLLGEYGEACVLSRMETTS